jgi:hypothetical protein
VTTTERGSTADSSQPDAPLGDAGGYTVGRRPTADKQHAPIAKSNIPIWPELAGVISRARNSAKQLC